MIMLAGYFRAALPRCRPTCKTRVVLLFLSPVVHNQNENQSDSEHSARNLNNRGSGHGNSSFFQQNAGCAPRFEQTRATPGAIMAKYPVRKTAGWPAKHTL
jgi:hypothetical protein